MAARPATESASILHLPVAPAVTPGPIDLSSLSQWELQVVFYAAGLRWRSDRQTSYQDLAAVVVEQVNRLGLDVVRELARQIKQAIDTCQWGTWEALLPGREARSDSDCFARQFQRRTGIAAHKPSAARAAWQHVIATVTSDQGRGVT